MPEVPPSREHHRHAVLVGGGDDLGVPHRTARLDDGGRSGGRDRVESVAERKERVRAATAPRSRSVRFRAAFMTATFTASTRLICPAPIASVRSGPVKMTVFDLTCAQTRQAKRSACHSAGGRAPSSSAPSGSAAAGSLQSSRASVTTSRS